MSFNVGDKVHVEFDATITEAARSYAGTRLHTYTVEQAGGKGSGAIHYLYLADDNAKVTKPAEPKNWPPQVGDIWEADGCEYFVYKGLLGLTAFPFSGAASGKDSYSEGSFTDFSLSDFKALNPKLVRRRPNNDWASAVAAADSISSHYNSMSFRFR